MTPTPRQRARLVVAALLAAPAAPASRVESFLAWHFADAAGLPSPGPAVVEGSGVALTDWVATDAIEPQADSSAPEAP